MLVTMVFGVRSVFRSNFSGDLNQILFLFLLLMFERDNKLRYLLNYRAELVRTPRWGFQCNKTTELSGLVGKTLRIDTNH